jgi:hypothetical protein
MKIFANSMKFKYEIQIRNIKQKVKIEKRKEWKNSPGPFQTAAAQ